jgi:hypothetical protein
VGSLVVGQVAILPRAGRAGQPTFGTVGGPEKISSRSGLAATAQTDRKGGAATDADRRQQRRRAIKAVGPLGRGFVVIDIDFPDGGARVSVGYFSWSKGR